MLRPELNIADAVRATRPADGVTLWLLGNAGVLLVDASGRRIAIDPWTSPWLETASAANPDPVVRQRAARLRSEELAELVDAVLVTHEHPDHLDPGLADALGARRPDRAAAGMSGRGAGMRLSGLSAAPGRRRGGRVGRRLRRRRRGCGARLVAARLAADHAYIDALRRGKQPVDARLGQDWLSGPHQSNREQARHTSG